MSHKDKHLDEMNELQYIGADDLVFTNEKNQQVHSGGFSVNSIMLKSGISPIRTVNSPDMKGGKGTKVSDLFNHLVVPNWALSYSNRIGGHRMEEREDDDYDEVVDDELHDKLLGMVREHEQRVAHRKKHTKKQMGTKKGKSTRKRK